MLVDKNGFFKGRQSSSSALERLGLVRIEAGVVSYSPLAGFYLQRLISLVEISLSSRGGLRYRLPILQESKLGKQSGRWESYKEKYEFDSMVLSSTAEEVASQCRAFLLSDPSESKFFQIEWKFRKELRAKGMLRTREFLMKDAYSFHRTYEDGSRELRRVHDIYMDFFEKLGLDVLTIQSRDSAMGGNLNFEYVVKSELGEGMIWPKNFIEEETGISCQGLSGNFSEKVEAVKVVELGHIFHLGDKYCKIFNPRSKLDFHFSCSYGLGLTRLLEVIFQEELSLRFLSGFSAFSSGASVKSNKVVNLNFGNHVNINFSKARLFFKGLPLIRALDKGYKLIFENKTVFLKDLDELERV